MTKVVCTPEPARAAAVAASGSIGVTLYGHSNWTVGGIGVQFLSSISSLGRQPSSVAWDFLSIALAVSAADTFIQRKDAADGWTRSIDLTVALSDPTPWQAVINELQQALRFLSGDLWELTFEGGGMACPRVDNELLNPYEDSVCLFSGGMDSTIGVLDLLSSGRRPVLVSQSYPKDARVQADIARQFSQRLRRFFANANPRWRGKNEPSMRTRSLLFLASGVVAASTIAGYSESTVDLFIPENGLISLNPPLTRRRIGSLSTRTTHPYFLKLVGEILDRVDLDIKISNPYSFQTKGEMLKLCKDPELLRHLLDDTVSCGKWKRKNQQCGRCIPCIIRRAAYLSAGVPDNSDYQYKDLRLVEAYDDVIAARIASARNADADYRRVLAASAPLPQDPITRNKLIDVCRRGFAEVDSYLTRAFAP